MCNVLLQGNQSFKDKCNELQHTINQQLKQLNHNHPELAEFDNFKAITSGWNKITHDFSSLTAPESFVRHTRLMEKLLKLISELGSSNKLHHSQDKKLRGLLEVGINIVPPVTEILGQARGMGAGVASQAKLSPQSRSKLRYLHHQAAVICENTATILSTQEATCQALDFSQCQTSIQLFLKTLDQELLNTECIQIESERYFAIASEAIGHSFEQLNQVMNEASIRLEKEYATHSQYLKMARLFTVISTSILMVVVFKFAS